MKWLLASTAVAMYKPTNICMVIRPGSRQSLLRWRGTPIHRHGISILVGNLLIVTAALKIYGLNVAPYAQHGWLRDPTVQLAAEEWEIVLGVWLVSGHRPAGAWAAAVLTFAAFAAVSASLGLSGQASCGCLGAVKSSPWLMFGIDLAALAMLAVARPEVRWGQGTDARLRSTEGSPPRWLLPTAGVVGGVLALTAGLIGAATLAHGSTEAALARLRGESVSVRPRWIDLGRGEVNQKVETTVEVVNWTMDPVRVYGGSSDCSCVATKSLPLTLEPGERRQVAVMVHLPGTPGSFNRKAIFWTDCVEARAVVFGLTSRVDVPPSTPDE